MSAATYYGRPILKPPTWTDLIPTYLFTGGLAGASATLSFAAKIRGERELERALDVTVLAALGVSTFCLIKDLGKPMRFVNMLRVVKPTSPMSMGTYILSTFGATFSAGFVMELIGAPAFAQYAFKAAAALLGPALATYTAVLISDTAAPAWHEGRATMPFLFASGAASSAAGAGLAFGPDDGALSQTLALIAAPAELVALQRLHGELGPALAHAYMSEKAKTYSVLARGLTIAGAIGAAFSGKNGALRRTAGMLLLAGAACERFAVMEAGRNSTRDPRYVIEQQR